ncbi:DNA-processing protein DprA [Chryseobacterium sp.]|uniref:DNA-processing protein DprA n=1 Tax=Chryseobacterium sp. TaxID=1871047 RepID=UPI0025BBC3EC|nr:DNA-processing protein DprA [Chryseobacterium sp.]
MYTEEHLYSIALRECLLIGDINFSKLVNTFGSAKNAWFQAKKEYQKVDGIGFKTVMDIGKTEHLQFAEKELQFCERNHIQISLKHLNQLPSLLNECDDAPSVLYHKGQLELSNPISIIGTRNISPYGKKFIKDFFEETKSFNFCSVSGLALGTDKEVHEQSINCNIKTIAILAHGFTTLYPSKNRKLSEKILEENGSLVTEFNSSRKPDRENFLQRNRIIAGLSPSTIVVETGFGGGSISTATYANNYNRDVYALPGKITDPYSQGCNHLIFQNKAAAISSIKNLIDSLGFNPSSLKMEELFPIPTEAIQLTENQSLIYHTILHNSQISLDDLAQKISIPTHKILPLILELELLGKIKSLSGRQFVVI